MIYKPFYKGYNSSGSGTRHFRTIIIHAIMHKNAEMQILKDNYITFIPAQKLVLTEMHS